MQFFREGVVEAGRPVRCCWCRLGEWYVCLRIFEEKSTEWNKGLEWAFGLLYSLAVLKSLWNPGDMSREDWFEDGSRANTLVTLFLPTQVGQRAPVRGRWFCKAWRLSSLPPDLNWALAASRASSCAVTCRFHGSSCPHTQCCPDRAHPITVTQHGWCHHFLKECLGCLFPRLLQFKGKLSVNRDCPRD